jgi:hypothetical protein
MGPAIFDQYYWLESLENHEPKTKMTFPLISDPLITRYFQIELGKYLKPENNQNANEDISCSV